MARTSSRVSLVSVVGPVEPRLLEAYLAHYLNLGVSRCFLAFHFPDDTDDLVRTGLHEACRSIIGEPLITNVGPWHEDTNSILRDQLRGAAGEGWHLLADVDEFHFYPVPLQAVISEAEIAGEGIVQGLLLDRVSDDGRLTAWPSGVDLDTAYPLGGLFTHLVLGGDARKIVLAHSGVEVASGNHRSPGCHATNDPVIPVHHFKWREGVLPYLRKRVDMFESGEWHEATPAMRLEADRFFSHFHAAGDRIDIQSPYLDFRPVSLRALPDGWERQSRSVVDTWRPRPYF